MIAELGYWVIPLGAVIGALLGLALAALRTVDAAPPNAAGSITTPGQAPAAPNKAQSVSDPAPTPTPQPSAAALAEIPSPPVSTVRDQDVQTHWLDRARRLAEEGRTASAHEALEQAMAEANDLMSRGHHQQAATMAEAIRAEAHPLQAWGLAADCHSLMGEALRAEDLPQAHRHFTAALDLYETKGDRYGIAHISDHLALIHAQLDDAAGAEAYYRYALSQRDRLGDRSAVVETLIALTAVVDHAGRSQEAMDLANRAETMAEALGDMTLKARAAAARRSLA